MYVTMALMLSVVTFCWFTPALWVRTLTYFKWCGFHLLISAGSRAPAAASSAWELHICCDSSSSMCNSSAQLTCQGPPALPIRGHLLWSPHLRLSIVRPSSASFVFATDVAFDWGRMIYLHRVIFHTIPPQEIWNEPPITLARPNKTPKLISCILMQATSKWKNQNKTCPFSDSLFNWVLYMTLFCYLLVWPVS